MSKPLTILSLGAGVQSSTMALMAAHGELTPMPDCAIFADTGAEPAQVYQYLDWLESVLPFPVRRVMQKDGLKVAIQQAGEERMATAPFFTGNGAGGMIRRQCTQEYKITPIIQQIRKEIGLKPRQRAKGVLVAQWIGISWDERMRMKDASQKWIKNRWPLIEQHLTRGHCLEWMMKHGYPKPAKSACTFCPYRDNKGWAEMKQTDPESFADAVEMDRFIRTGIRKIREEMYVHQSLKPLDEIDFSAPVERQVSFLDECDGMCGV